MAPSSIILQCLYGRVADLQNVLTRRKALNDPHAFTTHFAHPLPPVPTTERDMSALCFATNVWTYSMAERKNLMEHLKGDIQLVLRAKDMEAYRAVLKEHEEAQIEFREMEKEVSCHIVIDYRAAADS